MQVNREHSGPLYVAVETVSDVETPSRFPSISGVQFMANGLVFSLLLYFIFPQEHK